MPKSEGYTEFKINKGRDGPGPSKLLRDDQGPITNRRLKRVCAPCNNVWMGRCEEDAKTAVTHLIQGTETVLEEATLIILRKWVTQKLIVLDAIRDNEQAFTEEERRAFYNYNSIPDTLQVWILRCGVGIWSTMFWSHGQSVTLHIGEPLEVPPPIHASPNLKLFIWGVGEALVVATYQREIDIEFDTQEEFAVQLIPDLGISRAWPPKRISEESAEQITKTLDNIPSHLGARLIWRDLPDDVASSSSTAPLSDAHS